MPAGGDLLISSSAGEMLGTNNQEPASLPVKQDSPTAPPVNRNKASTVRFEDDFLHGRVPWRRGIASMID